MKKFVQLLLLMTLPLVVMASELKEGTLSVLLFSEGKPLTANEVKIDGKKVYKTDEDGAIKIRLHGGRHQVEIFGKNAAGENLGYFKKPVSIKEGRDTEIIATLSKTGADSIDIDTPVDVAKSIDKEAQKATGEGILTGKVLSSEGNTPIAGARVFVRGTAVDVRTDENGRFSVKVPSGKTLSISVVHSAYSAQTIGGIIVKKDSKTARTVKLTPASMELEEFVVLAPQVEGSITKGIEEQRSSDTVGNVLGSEQFSKSGDSSAASALKRVSGITIVGGKYVYVRGLGDRYSTILFNGLDLPSPEPTKRVVPLDIFPTSVIKSMTIQKSFSGDLPGTFGGGTVLIESKDIPEKPFIEMKIGMNANSKTGSSVIYNDSNDIGLPQNVIAASDNFRYINDYTLTQQVLNNRTYNSGETTIQPGIDLGLSFGDKYAITDDIEVGGSATLFYKTEADNDDIYFQKNIFDINTKTVYIDSTTNTSQTTLKERYGAMLNLGVNYGDDHTLKYTYFMVNDTSDSTLLSKIDFNGATEDRDKYYNEYVTKNLSTHQLSGSNNIHFADSDDGYFDNLKIDWAAEHAEATRDEPGTVETNYLHQTDGINWDQKSWFYYFMLDDTVDNFRVDLTLPFKNEENENYTKFGAFMYNKSRDFDSRRFKLSDKASSSTNIDLTWDIDTIYDYYYLGNLQFESAYRPTDSYSAQQDITAFYIKQLYSFTKNFDVMASVRYEDSTQQLTDTQTGQPYDPLVTSDILPGLGFTYRFDNDKMQIRGAVAQTITRPDFREFSPNRYKDPITENIVYGNPNLKATSITHFDLKYEWYPTADELLSFAIFEKSFTNPIETVFRKNDAQGNELEQSYANAKSASSYGVELDVRKRFGFIGDSWENLLIAGNFAWINSKIEIDRDAYPYFTQRLTTTDREMMGQSPYVVNFTFGYDNVDTGDSALLLYNEIGKNITALGTDGNEDIYLQPFQKLDFVTKWKVYENTMQYFVKLKAENLLDSTMEYTQGDEKAMSYKPGSSYSLQVDVKY